MNRQPRLFGLVALLTAGLLLVLSGCGPEQRPSAATPAVAPAPVAPAPTPPAPAPAEAPKLVIVKAVYGDLPDGPSADVTEKVAALVKDNALTMEVSNDLLGDPAEGAGKKLRVNYTLDGVAHSKTVGEDEFLYLPTSPKPLVGKLVVVKAVYGNLTGTDWADVTAKVAPMVQNNTLTVGATNDNFEDPAPSVYKRLRVNYTLNGVPQTRSVGENRTLTITGNAPAKAKAKRQQK